MAPPSMAVRLFCEFVGTFVLMFSVGCTVSLGIPFAGGAVYALVICLGTYALGRFSGANFNPAASIALGLTRLMGGPGLRPGAMAAYVCVQLVAGVLAARAFTTVIGFTFYYGPLNGELELPSALLVEFLFTCMYVFLVLNVGVARNSSPSVGYGLVMGFATLSGVYSTGGISGGCLNPALAIGLDLGGNDFQIFFSPQYAAAEILGALVALLLFRVLRPEDFGGPRGGIVAQCTSEFVGSFFFVLSIGMAILQMSPMAPIVIMSAIATMSIALFRVSGARLNSAITIAFTASGYAQLSLLRTLTFICAQCVGGAIAGLTFSVIFGGGYWPLVPTSAYLEAFAAEFCVVSILCYVILSRSMAKTSAGLAIAMGVGLPIGAMTLGSLSGGMMNPAATLGAFVAEAYANGFSYRGFEDLAVLVTAEVLGSFSAARLYSYTNPPELPPTGQAQIKLRRDDVA